MSKLLIITEKPAASKRIAEALFSNNAKKKAYKGIAYYEATEKDKTIFISCAVGHLYNLAEKEQTKDYPNFELEWKPSYEVSKSAKFTKKYLDTLKFLAKQSSEFIGATDLDLEGETILINILRFACKVKNAKRMRFSTLTKEELTNSYKNPSVLDKNLADSGETRHYTDFYWGINSSRALTNSIKNATNQYKVMSIGRVQGPTLKIIVEREKEIQSFKPVPYWQVQLIGSVKKENIEAWHEEDKFWEKNKADKVIERTKGKKAIVKELKRTKFKQLPPFPFDLTSLQLEAYRLFKISPSQTLQIAQSLYLRGIVSYPRTASNILPETLEYKKIIRDLSKQHEYKELCDELLKHKLKPSNGKKTDPAHPALFATGELPEKLDERESKIYDLIVRRTLATFAEPATRETMEILIDVNQEPFISKGTRTIEKGWHTYYGNYARFEEQELPDVKKGEEVNVKSINLLDKETQPPKRYTPASIIKKMSALELGTKATRSQILETLYDRHYIIDQQIQATALGIKTIETLQKYNPEIIDVKLTRHFEKEMQDIQEGKRNKEQVLEEARKTLVKIFKHFKENELKIGKELAEANLQTRRENSLIGKCPICNQGDLRILNPKNRKAFVACNQYPKCKTTYSLPQGMIKKTEKTCKFCNTPIIQVIRKGKRPFEMCLTYDCKSKENWVNYNNSNKI